MDKIGLYQRGYIPLADLTREEITEAVRTGAATKKDLALWELHFSWVELLSELDRVFKVSKVLNWISKRLK